MFCFQGKRLSFHKSAALVQETSNHPDQPSKPSRAAARPWLSGPFLRRTALATLATLGLVAATAVVYWHAGAWAGRYLVAGAWSLVFFGLTPLILKSFLFDRSPAVGLALVGFKVIWMLLIVIICQRWAAGGSLGVAQGSALLAGIVTPLAVACLRAIEVARRERKHAGHEPGAGGGSSSPRNLTLESRS